MFDPEAFWGHTELHSIHSVIHPWNTRADVLYAIASIVVKIPKRLVIREEIEFSVDPHIEEDPRETGPTISGPEFDFSVDRFYNAAIP